MYEGVHVIKLLEKIYIIHHKHLNIIFLTKVTIVTPKSDPIELAFTIFVLYNVPYDKAIAKW
jgi:hypothetical protein